MSIFTLKNLRIFKSVSLYMIASMLQAVVSIIMNPILALNLSHDDFAIIGYFRSFSPLILPLFSLMFSQYYTRQYFNIKEHQRKKLFDSLISIQIILGIFVYSIIAICFYWYSIKIELKFPVFPFMFLSFGSVFFNSMYGMVLIRLKMERKVKSFLKLSLLNISIITSLTLILVVLFKYNATGRLLALFLAAFAIFIFCYLKMNVSFIIDKKITIDACLFTWPLIIAGSMNYFFTGYDRSLLVQLDDVETFALYNIAVTVCSYITLFNNSLSDTFQPDIFKAVAEKNKKQLIKVVAGIQIMNLFPVGSFCVLCPFIMKLLTAGRYTDSYVFARIIAFASFTSLLYYSLSRIITALGYTKVTLINKIIGTVLSVMLFSYLIDNWGFMGAAWGQVLSFFIMACCSFCFIVFRFKLKKTYL